MTDTTIRVLLADDHRVVLDGLIARLAQVPQIEVVGTARSFEDVKQFLAHTPVDVVLLDLLSMQGSMQSLSTSSIAFSAACVCSSK